MNAVNEDMYKELYGVLNRFIYDVRVKVVIITGCSRIKNGVEKQAFCAGADMKEHSEGRRSFDQKRNYIEEAHSVVGFIYKYPKPTIAAINGPARGAGVEMALACDFVIMEEEATIAFPETSLGSFVGGGVTYILPRNIGLMKAKELIYNGRILNGREAVELGISLKCYYIDNFMENVFNFAEDLAKKAPISVKKAKSLIQDSYKLDVEDALNLETEVILECMETEDWKEGVNSFIENREPKYKGE